MGQVDDMVWKPRVTVAIVAEQNGRYLMVEENIDGQIRFNQPAGHLEDDESLVDAAVRECLEETAWQFEPQALVGIYRWRNAGLGDTYLRVTFAGRCTNYRAELPLDTGIVAAHWLTIEEIRQREAQLRSPLVLASVDDYLQGKRYPLDLLIDIEGAGVA
jgi:8-oxo-dGTP pyrophosphatase MutT (NUDIX family)